MFKHARHKPGNAGVNLGAGVILTLLTAAAIAQQNLPQAVALETEEEEVRRYSVEMIVFEYADQAGGGSEVFLPDEPEILPAEDAFPGRDPLRFPDGPDRPDSELPIFDENPAVTDSASPMEEMPLEELEEIPTHERAGLVLLDPEEYVLIDEFERLDRLDAYRPLMHTAWIQPTLEKEQTMPFKLRRLGDPPLRLEGTVTLYLSRFLHLVMDLSLEEKSPLRPTQSRDRIRYFGDNRGNTAYDFDSRFIVPSTFYRIQEDRIVRNGELRYYDHPKFGVLAKITRIEEEAPDDLDNTDDLLPGGINP